MPFHPPTAAWMLALAGASPRYSQRPAMGPNDLWSPLPIQHVDVNLDDGSVVDIAYVDSGPPPEGDPAAPPLVLIHGLSSGISYWEYQIAPLAQQHRVIAGGGKAQAQCDRRKDVAGLRPGDQGDPHWPHPATAVGLGWWA